MDTAASTGYLVIADLTGYTSYLASSEIEHAPIIAGDLLETIVGRLEPPFRLSKFEGDAAFVHVEDGRADPPCCSTPSRPRTSPSGADFGASNRRRAAIAPRAGWPRGST